MELIRSPHRLAPGHRGCVVSIGNFDGLHRGHQALIEKLKALAVEHQLPSTVIVFEPMPREYFAPDAAPPRVSGFRGRLRGLARAGVDRVLCLRFDARMAAMSPQAFVDQILVAGLGARAIVVGDDFRFGHKRAGDLALLQWLGTTRGFTAEGVGSVFSGEDRCSSTLLRNALAIPDLPQARQLLGRNFRMFGPVRKGLQLGRTLGMPTANIYVRRARALAHGVYAVRAHAGRLLQGAPAVASLGVRPTLGNTAPVLETHVFDFAGSLYGIELEVEFCHYLRPQLKFDSLDRLAAQMQADGEQAREYLNHPKATT